MEMTKLYFVCLYSFFEFLVFFLGGGGFKAKLFFQVFYFFLSCYFCVCTCFAMFTVQCGTACSVCRPDNPDHCLVCKQPGLLLQRGSCVTSCQDNFYVTRDAKCAGNIFQTLPLTLHQVLTGFGVKIYYSLIFFVNWSQIIDIMSSSLFPNTWTPIFPPLIHLEHSQKVDFDVQRWFFVLGWFEQMHLLK